MRKQKLCKGFFYPHPRTFSFAFFFYRERGRERKKHWCKRSTHRLPPHAPRLGIQARTKDHTCLDQGWTQNPGMCPEWESNPQPFGYLLDALTTDPHRPGQNYVSFKDNLRLPSKEYSQDSNSGLSAVKAWTLCISLPPQSLTPSSFQLCLDLSKMSLSALLLW